MEFVSETKSKIIYNKDFDIIQFVDFISSRILIEEIKFKEWVEKNFTGHEKLTGNVKKKASEDIKKILTYYGF